jgi:hypothetical protein
VLLALKSELPKHARDGFFVFGARDCFAGNDQNIPLSVRPLRLLSFSAVRLRAAAFFCFWSRICVRSPLSEVCGGRQPCAWSGGLRVGLTVPCSGLAPELGFDLSLARAVTQVEGAISSRARCVESAVHSYRRRGCISDWNLDGLVPTNFRKTRAKWLGF